MPHRSWQIASREPYHGSASRFIMFRCISLCFVLQGEGSRAYADKARDGRVGKILTLADKAGRGGLANADIS